MTNQPGQDRFLSQRHTTLPNGMEIAYQNKAELEHFYRDIFEHKIYLPSGIMLKDGDCVFDVGANIGLFTLFVHSRQKDINIYSFEPAPALFAILGANIENHAVSAKIFNLGLSSTNTTANFTFYPRSSGMSTFYADIAEEKEVLRSIMLNQLEQDMSGMDQIMAYAEDLLEERFKSETFTCQLRTLSDVIYEYAIDRIDLLKIDVQKSELDVLNGINQDDWRRVNQIVMEVHDIGDRLKHIVSVLEKHGFNVNFEQDALYKGSAIYNLAATRVHFAGTTQDGRDSVMPEEELLYQIQDRSVKQKQAQQRQRQSAERRRKLHG